MKGYNIGEIKWRKDGYGKQFFRLAAMKFYSADKTHYRGSFKLSHYKVWVRGYNGGREFVGRADTAKEATKIINKHKETVDILC